MKNTPQITDELRAIPLEELLRWRGYELKREGNSFRVKDDAVNIVITGQKWYDNSAGVGGAGAIDLQMHLSGNSFVDTCTLLREHFPLRVAYQGCTRPKRQKSQEMGSDRVPFHLLISRYAARDDKQWHIGRDYLVGQRGITGELVDQLHDAGLVYTNGHIPNPSLVFLHRRAGGSVAGATLRDTRHDSRFCPTLGNKLYAWFHTGDLSKVEKIVAVESPIDALSYKCLHGDPGANYAVVSCGGSVIPEDLMNFARGLGQSFVAALDNDAAGVRGAQKAWAEVSTWPDFKFSVERPPLKDWNDVLRSVAQVSAGGLEPPARRAIHL
jgi:hypothetical protein